MAKGMSSRSGPPPDPNALRREHDKGEWRTLPTEGRRGPAPPWPLTDADDREAQLWEREWRRPQALMWEANGLEIEVAIYVRTLAESEAAGASTNRRTLLKQQMEALGVSMPGLRANRWRIGDASLEKRATGTAGRSRPRASGRLKVVEGGDT